MAVCPQPIHTLFFLHRKHNSSTSFVAIRLTLARPLRTLEEGSAEGTGPATEEPRPFARAVFVVEYEEGGRLVREVTSSLDQINGRALKDVQGTLRAYRFTEEVSSVTRQCFS